MDHTASSSALAQILEAAKYLTIITVFVAAGATIVGVIGMIKMPAETLKFMEELVKSGSLIRLATILGIVAAIVILCVVGNISGEASVAALSGIAGYVLGGEKLTHSKNPVQ